MKTLIHSLDPEMAKIVGVNAALIYQKICHYCRYHEDEGTNFHDGLHWSYNTHAGMQKQFTYLTVRQIRTALEKLLKSKAIVSGNYNKFKNDRTLWYAINPDFHMTLKSNVTNDTEVISTNDTEVTALPIETSKDTVKTIISQKQSIPYEEILKLYNDFAKQHGITVSRGLNPKKKSNIRTTYLKHGMKGIHEAFEIIPRCPHLLGRNDRGWKASLEFVFREDKFDSILEGNYEERPINQHSGKASGSRSPRGQQETQGFAGSVFRELDEVLERRGFSESGDSGGARESDEQLPLISDR